MDPRLQPLRIPAGWTVAYSKLLEIDPSDVPDDDRYFFLDEDLLQMHHDPVPGRSLRDQSGE